MYWKYTILFLKEYSIHSQIIVTVDLLNYV
jgi:hypothetical protein